MQWGNRNIGLLKPRHFVLHSTFEKKNDFLIHIKDITDIFFFLSCPDSHMNSIRYNFVPNYLTSCIHSSQISPLHKTQQRTFLKVITKYKSKNGNSTMWTSWYVPYLFVLFLLQKTPVCSIDTRKSTEYLLTRESTGSKVNTN